VVPKWFHEHHGQESAGTCLYRVIKREAKKNRRSLNAEIIQVLEMEAAEAERLRQFGDLRKELERFAATLPPLDDSAPLIRRDRER
jgi:hypothetical protein